jgi:GGDEF domain-containing protein
VHEQSHVDRTPRRIELSAEELSLLLGAERFGGPAQGIADEPSPEDAGAQASADASAHVSALEPTPAPATAPEPTPVQAPDAVTPPSGGQRGPGDADLLQAILEGSPNIEQLALRVVRDRTGEDLCRILSGSAAEAMVATGTGSWVSEGHALVAPIAPDARAAWAGWMARWLELAKLVALRAPRGLWDDATGFPSWARMRTQVAHRIASSRLRRECLFVSVLRVVDAELWNRRSQVLVDEPFLARAAGALDAAVCPGDEIGRLDDGGFVVVTAREAGAADLLAALRGEIARLPGDGPRSLVVHVGTATAPWDATAPDQLLEVAALRAADAANGR